MEILSSLWVINVQKLALRCFENLHVSLTSISICWTWSVPRATWGMRAPCRFLWQDLQPFEGLEHLVKITPLLPCGTHQVPAAQTGMAERKTSLVFLLEGLQSFSSFLASAARACGGSTGCSCPTSTGEGDTLPASSAVATVCSTLEVLPLSWGASQSRRHQAAWAALRRFQLSRNTAQRLLAWKTPTCCLLPAVSFA